ncbi:unnamed protein product [Ambrosiozyma monospora]|uniref:Unnamed protein product n=1 Tax=Ambrosiozyma monospora TaxID=43982 RepID=A0ACB5SRM9_AMBMO|nr:unnamed protein product [Ambrosiozyma monospora]
MSNTLTASSTLKLRSQADKQSQIYNEEPLDKKIEHIVRDSKNLHIGVKPNTSKLVFGQPDPEGLTILPETTKQRFVESGIDISRGYPERPSKEAVPVYLDEAFAIRNDDYPHIERGKNADPEKKALFGAATEVIDLTKNVGTEIVGLQLADLNDKQKDELALLISERIVVFFRHQKLSPQKQLELGEYWGRVEKHPQAYQVNGLPGITVIWNDFAALKNQKKYTFKNNNIGNFDSVKYNSGSLSWHGDLSQENQPPGVTHLHLDTIPDNGGDTMWASGYAAYDKLSEEFKKFLDGKKAVFSSAHKYLDRNDPFGGPKRIERVHPLVRTHPATGWKYLFVNREHTERILGVSPVESDIILNYLFDVYEKNADIQVRFKWGPTEPGYGVSALWDNRISQHRAVWDHEGNDARHGTRVSSLSDKPYFDPKSKSQREALGLSLEE